MLFFLFCRSFYGCCLFYFHNLLFGQQQWQRVFCPYFFILFGLPHQRHSTPEIFLGVRHSERRVHVPTKYCEDKINAHPHSSD